jgi:leucyl-tRNA synthetase
VERYNPHAIEAHWQQRWAETHIYEPNLSGAEKPFYNLMMFPYPSAEGLHVGNVYAYTGADIYGRFKAMHGYDVFEPIGFDAFGMHSENFAIKQGIHPRQLTSTNIQHFKAQLTSIGNRFDWRQAVETTSPAYYRWTQWVFLQLFKAGLAVRKRAPVNWCPTDQTVLADEQVIDGLCERCDTPVVQRELEQWFLRITAYAERLRANLDQLDWSDVVKHSQRHWIGQLRDWLISRQRYWGTPIPIVYCPTCGTVPVPEDELPVTLPAMSDWQPRTTGSSPLAEVPEFVHTRCPQCAGPARRETDVCDNFLDSAWYYLRYPSADCADRAFDVERTSKWLPVSMYVGGAEHAVLHLLYSRFICMALYDLGLVPFAEPYVRFRANGLLTLNGAKMSKSRGNVVNPETYIERFGADTLRVYLMFLGPFERGGEFNDDGIAGVSRFLQRVWRLFQQPCIDCTVDRAALHRTIRQVGDDVAALRYHTAIAALMGHVNRLDRGLNAEEADVLPRLLAPFAQHLAEEVWPGTYSVHQQAWPAFDATLLADDVAHLAVQVNGRTKGVVEVSRQASEAEALAAAREHIGPTQPRRVIYVPGRVLNVLR